MAVGRQLNAKGQMRIDVPHLRLIESGVVYDFDTLAGGILAGKKPYVVTGFVPAAWVNGAAASSLSLVTASSIFVNYNASENGSMLMVPADRAPESLVVTNSRVVGGFTVSQTNYVSLDLIRTEDATTSDVVHFIDPATGQGTPKIIPLGRTMDYRIYISTTPFSATPQRCPVMIVTTDASNNIVSVTDARPMLYRLASGGDSPNPLGVYSWPQGRTESANSFVGGDKAITNMKDWASAVMQRIWELTGGEYWYSDVTDRNLKFYADNTDSHTRAGITNNQIWDGTDVTWSGFGIAFGGSTAYINEIADQPAASPGLTDLAAGECIYVDYDRSTNHLRSGTPLTAHKTTLSNLGTPTKPGVRTVIFWRPDGSSKVYSRLDYLAIGQYSGAATTTTYGVVKLSSTSAIAGGPFVPPVNGAGYVEATGLSRGYALGAGSVSIANNVDVDTGYHHFGNPACTGVAIESGPLVGIALTSQRNISLFSGVTTLVGITSIDSYQSITMGTATDATITIGKSTSATQVTSIFSKTIHINDSVAGVTTVIGNGNGGTSTAIYGNTINIGGHISLDIGTNTMYSSATNFYINDQNAGSNTTIACNLATGQTNNLYLGTGHTGTGHTDIYIGVGGNGLTQILGQTMNIATSGASVTSIGVYGAGSVGIRANTLTLQSDGACAILTGGGDGLVTIGNSTNKARAGAATVAGDNSLTLATKGFVANTGVTWQAPPTNFTFVNTYANTGTNPFGYALDNHGIMHLRGVVSAGAAPGGNSIGTFAAGYYPPTNSMRFSAWVTNAAGTAWYPAFISVLSNGIVTAQYITAFGGALTDPGANMLIWLEGISYPVW